MVDIAMCKSTDCKLKDTCYRYVAEPSEYQTVGLFAPSSDTQCEFYWKISSQGEIDLLNKNWEE